MKDLTLEQCNYVGIDNHKDLGRSLKELWKELRERLWNL